MRDGVVGQFPIIPFLRTWTLAVRSVTRIQQKLHAVRMWGSIQAGGLIGVLIEILYERLEFRPVLQVIEIRV